MKYTTQCTDIVSGETGCFGYDLAEYMAADKPLQFRAITPVFSGLVEFFQYAKAHGITLDHAPVNWKPRAPEQRGE